MLKISFLNILLCLFAKYAVFFTILAFMNDRFKSLVVDTAQNNQGLFMNSIHYILYILVFSLILSLLFSAPIYFSFKVSNPIYFTLIIIGFLVAEYFIYTYLASQKELMNGLYNGVMSIVFLLLFFYKPISNVFK